jgi:hypothetical protein
MAGDTASMKCGAGIQHAGGYGTMAKTASSVHLGACGGVMTDCAVCPFARGVAVVIEKYGASARRQLDDRS